MGSGDDFGSNFDGKPDFRQSDFPGWNIKTRRDGDTQFDFNLGRIVVGKVGVVKLLSRRIDAVYDAREDGCKGVGISLITGISSGTTCPTGLARIGLARFDSVPCLQWNLPTSRNAEGQNFFFEQRPEVVAI